jgi:hypothetical protein
VFERLNTRQKQLLIEKKHGRALDTILENENAYEAKYEPNRYYKDRDGVNTASSSGSKSSYSI